MWVLLLALPVVHGAEYFGLHLGRFRNASYALDGDVYLVNRSHIQIVDLNVKRMISQQLCGRTQKIVQILDRARLEFRFSYESQESPADAVYEYKISERRAWLQTNERELRDGAVNRRLIVAIPGDVSHWKRFGIVDMEEQDTISSVSLEREPPEPFCCIRNGKEYYAIEGEYGVRVDPIEVIDAKTLKLPNFNFQGTKPPDGWFYAGKGPEILQTTGKKALIVGKDTEYHHCAMHEDYSNEELTIRLGGSQTVNDIEWLSVFCYQYEHDFGHVKVEIDQSKTPVPAYLPPVSNGPPPKRKVKPCE